jgi:hypothetical protein
VASFVLETEDLISAQVEERIENLCLLFEGRKDYLAALWGEQPMIPESAPLPDRMEVSTHD